MNYVSKATIAAIIFSMANYAGAAGIGINFTGGGNGRGAAISVAATDSAGVVPQMNYNNIDGSGVTGAALIDNNGAATTATLSFTSGGTYSSIANATPAGGDEALNTGFVYGDGNFTISNIPYASYDVYVYTLNDASGRVETVTANGVSYYNSAANPGDSGHVDQNAATNYVYTQSISTDLANPTPGGDYALFTGNTGASFSFTDSAPGNGYLNGIEIVSTPEPASIGFMCVAAAGLLARRRRA